MFVAQAHSFRQQVRLAVTLAWIAGYTNIVTLIVCGTATSHMSGAVSQLGRDVVEGRWSVTYFTLFLVLSFLIGAALSAVCTETGRRRGWESIYVLPMALELALLAIFAVGVEVLGTTNGSDPTSTGSAALALLSTRSTYFLTGIASLAMGLQNATITRISGGVVRTTHMTGVVTDLGLEGVQFIYWLHDQRRGNTEFISGRFARSLHQHPTAKRLALLGSVIGSFGLGAGLGAAAHESIPGWVMFPPVLFLLWIIYQDYRTPICEIQASHSVAETTGLVMPQQIAVYHMKRDTTRRGKVQRLPDLQRWWTTLPKETAIVILDFSDTKQLHPNAALELRTLMQQADSQGRRLLLSGITAEQREALQASGAGDAMKHANVCADLDSAVARAMALAVMGFE